ncbi:MAG: MFS transporter [Actinobacteria bacterium]|nr:MFS transporter [Actinomycetota bacterium]
MNTRPGHRRSALPLLQLEAATVLSGAGNGAALVILPWLVLERTGDAADAGILGAATALPLLFSSIFSGAIVDRVGRRRTSIGSDLFSAVSAASIPIVAATIGLNLPVLIALAVLGAVFDPAGVTARETMLPDAAERSGWRLQRVNGVHEAVWGVAFLMGPGIGGLLIAAVGAASALWFTAGAFVFSALIVWTIRLPNADLRPDPDLSEGILGSIRTGVDFVRHDRLLLTLLLVIGGLVAFYMPVESVLLPVEFEARNEPGRLGLLVTTVSAGWAVGALLYAWLGHRVRRSWLFRGGLLATAAALALLVAVDSYPLMLLTGFALGVGYGPVGPILNLALQTRSPEHLRGRIVGLASTAEYAAGPAGFLVVGVATSWLGVSTAFALTAAIVAAVAVTSLLLRPLDLLDELPDEPTEHPITDATLDRGAGPLPFH